MLPKALQKQEEEANKMYASAYAEDKDQEDIVSGEEEPEETPSEPEEEVEEPEEEEREEPEVVNWQEKAQFFENKFNVLQNKYNSEVPVLANELRQIKERLASGESPERIGDKEDKKALTPDKVYEQMVEDYGEDFANDMRNYIRAEANQSIAPMAESVQAAQSTATHFARERYFAELDKLVPGWEEDLKDPKFRAYSEENDEFTGVPRYVLMQNAEQGFNAHRIAAFYNAYRKKSGKPVSRASGKKMASVTPGGKPSKPAGVTPTKDMYVTRAFMNQFAKDVSLRKYAGREDEVKKIQAKIDRAVANGWIM